MTQNKQREEEKKKKRSMALMMKDAVKVRKTSYELSCF